MASIEYGTYHRVLTGERSGAIVRVVGVHGQAARCEIAEPHELGRVEVAVGDLEALTDEQITAFFMRDAIRNAISNDRLVVVTTKDGDTFRGAIGTIDDDKVLVMAGTSRLLPGPDKPMAVSPVSGTQAVALSDVEDVNYDHDAERARREAADRQAAEDVTAAYATISQALNSDHGIGALRDALAGEHPTLLGKLANEVLAAVDARDGDQRVGMLTRTVADVANVTPDLRVSELRQPLV